MHGSIRVFPIACLLFFGCETPKESGEPNLADFKSDGCSLFVDGTFKDRELWKELLRRARRCLLEGRYCR